MISLKQKLEPRWITLGYGIDVFCKPITPLIFNMAQSRRTKEAPVIGEILIAEHGEENVTDEMRLGAMESYLRVVLATLCITDWKGVPDDDDESKTAACTAENIKTLMESLPVSWVLQENFWNKAVASLDLLLDEKKSFVS